MNIHPRDFDAPALATARTATVAGVVLVIAGVIADLLLPADVLAPMLGACGVAALARSRNTRLVWSMAALAVFTLIVAWWLGPLPGNQQVFPAVVLNRALVAIAILVIAALAHLKIRSEHTTEQYLAQLDQQNQELETLNEELSQREEEIVRQNEELQSQTEELERQSEELRVTNAELTHWERTLEQLLELSRALTADLSRDETLSKICEALVMLSEGHPAAVLEKQGDDLEIICYQGFPQGGPGVDRIPYANSFSAMVMSVSQTAYLEDAQLRPELRLVQPQQGPAFRSFLSAPLRAHGRCVGTIELYSVQPRTWDESHISMIESLAAQASISLQGAELMEAVAREKRRFESAFRTVPFGMLVADDPKCNEVRLNPAAARLLNVSVDDNLSPNSTVGAKLRRCLYRGGKPLPIEQQPLIRAASGEDVTNEEIELRHPSGQQLSLLVSAAPIYDTSGAISGAVVAFADVTEQKELQRELELRRREAEEASVRKTRFLAAVSHDIRTPANAISLMAELIRRYASDPKLVDQIAGCAADLQRNTLALIELVGDVLDLARFDSGKVDLVESEFALAELIEQEVNQLRPVANEKGLALFIDPLKNNFWLRTDRIKLGRVLGNLIGNAIKFTQHGSVRVSAAVEVDGQRDVVICVADTGPGIPADQLPAIFDEFRQLHNPARDRMKGTGLGLSICSRLVEVLGGQIKVDSSVGQGTTFSIVLPAKSIALRLEPALRTGALDPAEQTKRVLESPLLSLRVLLVEDHGSTRDGTARILRAEGADVDEAENGQQALDLLASTQPEVLLLDMMLPDIDGTEILRRLRDNPPASLRAVFVLTGDLTEQRRDEVRMLGADGLIEKPIDVKKLIGKLRGLDLTGILAARNSTPQADSAN